MPSALGGFVRWRERQNHERLEQSEDAADNINNTGDPTTVVASSSSPPNGVETIEIDLEGGRSSSSRDVNIHEGTGDEGRGESPENQENTSGAVVNTTSDDDDDDSSDDGEEDMFRTSDTLVDRMTLRELEEERDLARRRTSACMLLAIFLLFRLWIEALTQADFGLLLLCMVGTSWTARFVRYNREREEDLDRRIHQYENNNNDDGSRTDLRMMSFQAQLALALMESQRQMMNGGFGHPDGPPAQTGVSDFAKQQWETIQYKHGVEGYGSVGDEEEEEPHCSICLGEYEDGDTLMKLPCKHIYHDECIGGWTLNHVRCPLCNYDLESAAATTDAAVANTTQQPARN